MPVLMVPQAADGPDIMEVVAQYWEKVGIVINRSTIEMSNFYPMLRARKIKKAWVFSAPINGEVSSTYMVTATTKAGFPVLPQKVEHDKAIAEIISELNPKKRLELKTKFAQYLYDEYYGVMIGVKSTTWAVSPKMGDWPMMLPSTFLNYWEYATPKQR